MDLTAKVVAQAKVLQRMVVHADLQYSIIDHNEALLIRMMKKMSAQGGVSGCREDELRKKGNEDEDDDPSEQRESELPSSSPSRLGTQTQTQGESFKTGEGSGKGLVEEDDTIEALLDIDDFIFDSDVSNKEAGLEKGEMLPPVIEDWKSDDEVLPNEDEDINEHIVLN